MIKYLHHRAPCDDAERILLVMLPGAGIDAGAFADQGMVAVLHERGLAVDVVAAHPDLELYLDGSVADALHRTIVEPAMAQGYLRFWFLGISLGGMGALLYSSRHAMHVEGLVLLAPFLGTQGTVAGIAEAGGFASAAGPGLATTVTEEQMLAWLRDFLVRRPSRPALYLGYGRADRFVLGHRMLAGALPEERVVTEAGGHDWDTWLSLWRRVLDAAPFRTHSGDST